MLKVATLTAAALIATTASAVAHDTAPIDRTRAIQDSQIEQGRYQGDLTRREYHQLKAEQARIAEMERRAKADGVVTGREYREIRQAQADASRHIYQERHDEQVSWYRRWLYLNR